MPEATPGKIWMSCAWQLSGQCWIRSVQDSRLAARFPSWASLAEPENVTAWPAPAFVPADGVWIEGTGGVFEAEISRVSVSERSPASVTRRPTVTVDWLLNTLVGVGLLELSKAPSPSRSQA